MKNGHQNSGANVAYALPVPAATPSGAVLVIGEGLRVLTLTARATAATIADGSSAQGLADGQASCELIGVARTVRLLIATAAAVGDKIYLVADGTYTTADAGNTFIGYILEPLAAAGIAPVALIASA